jgi:hypothetical protein
MNSLKSQAIRLRQLVTAKKFISMRNSTSEPFPPELLAVVTLPPRLDKEIAELLQEHAVNVQEEGDHIAIILPSFKLGEGFNKASSDLLIQVPRSYPDAGPDMFWLDVDITLANGSIPQSAESTATLSGRNWRRFSWHRAAWNPSVDNLHGYLEFIRRRLREKK